MNVAVLTLWAALVAVIALGVWAWHAPHLLRYSWQMIRRHWLRSAIIMAGLMLATMLVETATVVNDAIVLAVKQVAITSVGKVDEEITSGGGGLGLFATSVGADAIHTLHGDRQVAGVAPALEVPGTLVVNDTARQVHGNITLLALDSGAAGPLGKFRNPHQQARELPTLSGSGAWLNARAAALLSANVGDQLHGFSGYWSGQTLGLRVSAIVDDGPLGKTPTIVVAMPTLQGVARAPDQINRIFIANTGDPLNTVSQSAGITARVQAIMPAGFQVRQAKAEAVAYALEAETLFGRILGLYTLFALAVDVLLIFLIFALLAAERRNEMGTLRALGLQRGELVATLALEAAAYNLGAAIPGALAGLGLGAAIIAIISPAVTALGFPLTVPVALPQFLSAVCLGFLFSLAVTIVAIWLTSGLSITAALRNVPDPPATPPSLGALLAQARQGWRAPLALWRAGLALLWGACWRGMVPLAAGLGLFFWAEHTSNGLLAPVGWVLAVGGAVLLARWFALWQTQRQIARLPERQRISTVNRMVDRINRGAAVLCGGYVIALWGVPTGLARFLGPRRFDGGLQGFFIAGLLMVLGAVLALTINLRAVLAPLRRLGALRGHWRHVQAIALVYPAAQRWRSGIVLALFALVCFVMVVMASLANSTTQRFAAVGNLTGGYDIIAQPLSQPLGDLATFQQTLTARNPRLAASIRTASAAAALPLGIIDPTATDAGWRLYPASAIQGAFLQGTGLPLAARAAGFNADDAVWQAVRDHPGNVVIDAGALDPDQAAQLGIQPPPMPPLERYAAPPIAATRLGPDALAAATNQPQTQSLLNQAGPEVRQILQQPERLRTYSLQLSHLTDAQGQFQPTTIWAEDFRGHASSIPLTVIGIVDNVQGQRYGLLGTPATFAPFVCASLNCWSPVPNPIFGLPKDSAPRLEVMMITELEKSARRPAASVRRASPNTCKSRSKISGWAFSNSSSRITENGWSRTLDVRSPSDWSNELLTRREAECGSQNSLMSSRSNRSRLP